MSDKSKEKLDEVVKQRRFLIQYGYINNFGQFMNVVTNYLGFDFPSREKIIEQIKSENSNNSEIQPAILSISELPLNW